MHISDGVLSPYVVGIGWAVALPTLAMSVRRLRTERVGTYGVVAAAFFAGSTIHVPIGPFSMSSLRCPVLSGLSVSVHQHEKVGVIGPSGADKTTFFWHLNGLLKPNSGYVEVLDRPLTEHKNINEIRRHVALTFQQVNDQLFCSSVWEEIAFGPRNLGWSKQRVRETVEKWLAYFELDEVSHRPPHHLSGGQKRSVALAAAMAMEPQLLILDEPANDLDHRNRRRLITYLQGLQTAIMVASHDLYLISEVTERCVLMDNGRIVSDRPTRELIQDKDTLKRYGMEAIKM